MSASMRFVNRNLARRVVSLRLRKASAVITLATQRCVCHRASPASVISPASVVSPALPPAVDRRLYYCTQKQNGDGLGQQQTESVADNKDVKDTDREKEAEKEEEREEEYENGVRERVLNASLNHVLEHGWSQQAIEAGAADEGLSEAANGMFEHGNAELVSYFNQKCNKKLVEFMKQEVERLKADGQEKPIAKEFIQKAVEERLKMTIPYHSTWKEAMAIQAHPTNAPQSLKNLSSLCDDIWHYAGDESTDFEWYTKRVSLGAIYEATEIYMLQDTSPDFTDTWAFLANRIKDVENLGSIKNALGPLGDRLFDLLKMGKNMLGMNPRNR